MPFFPGRGRRSLNLNLFNLFCLAPGDSDVFVLCLTTLLTALGEEQDAGTLVELLNACGAALVASPAAGFLVVDVLGEKITEKSIRAELRGDKGVKEALAAVTSYF